MDIVYLCKDGPNEELGYSLRTLVNIPHDRVFIVGGCPSKIDTAKVTYIHTNNNINKWRNSTNNLITACKDNRLSDDFILFNDDFFILKPISLDDLHVNRGPLSEVYKYYYNKYGNNEYTKGMLQTAEFLAKMGHKTILSYELHLPMVLNKKKVLEMFSLPGVMDIPVIHKRTLYGNLYKTGTKSVKDCKIIGAFLSGLATGKFLSTMDVNFPSARCFLNGLFPIKSKYER